MRPYRPLRSGRPFHKLFSIPTCSQPSRLSANHWRCFHSSVSRLTQVPDVAFAFESVPLERILYLCYSLGDSIDGVLLRASKPIAGAAEALHTLQDRGIPFILLTNGGGKHETE